MLLSRSSTINMQNTYNDLPPELLDHIFRYGCTLSISFCLTLSQTSSWTRKIALPYLYSAITLKNTTIYRTTQLTRRDHALVISVNSLIYSNGFLYGNHVRGLWFSGMLLAAFMPIYRSYKHLSRIALEEQDVRLISLLYSESSKSENPIMYQALLEVSVTHLLIFSAEYPTSPFPYSIPGQKTFSPFFRKITHLRFGQIDSYSSYRDFTALDSLSHIAIPYYHPQKQSLPDLLDIFDQLSTISLVVVLLIDKLSEEKLQDALRWVADMRRKNYQISAVLSKLEDLQTEWEEEVRYGQSIWDKADLFTQSLPSHLS